MEQRTRSAPLKNGKLLAEGEVLKIEVGPGSEPRPGCGNYGEQERKHGAIYSPRTISCGRTWKREAISWRIVSSWRGAVLRWPTRLGDGLRAEPAVVAALPAEARAQLAARLPTGSTD